MTSLQKLIVQKMREDCRLWHDSMRAEEAWLVGNNCNRRVQMRTVRALVDLNTIEEVGPEHDKNFWSKHDVQYKLVGVPWKE